jgi:beta-lactamase class D
MLAEMIPRAALLSVLVLELARANEDPSGGIDRFWLGRSLRISPVEQVAFLARLHAGPLQASFGRSPS